jgi:hypothetical protein
MGMRTAGKRKEERGKRLRMRLRTSSARVGSRGVGFVGSGYWDDVQLDAVESGKSCAVLSFLFPLSSFLAV